MRVQGTTLAFCLVLGAAMTAPEREAGAAQDQAGQASSHGVVNPAGQAAAGSHASHRSTAQRGRASARNAAQHAAATPHRGRAAHRAAPATYSRTTYASYGGGISCVPYARMITGMQITGNGWQWWHNAAGSYDRGQRPERGSVLAFRSSGGMSRGHVAVVSQVMGPRHLRIDHANWGGPGIPRGSIMRDINVIDVSENNDWTAVRVQTGWNQGSYGRTYPTYGFIYNRPERGRLMTASFIGPVQPATAATGFEQVAEMPAAGGRGRGAPAR